jgi:hypothetical protein
MHPEQIAQLAYHHQANLLAEARAVQQAPARRRLALFRHHRRPARPVGPEC